MLFSIFAELVIIIAQKEEYISFDRYAEIYDRTRAISLQLLARFLKEIDLFVQERHIGNRVLELGCGTGRVTKVLAQGGYSVTGVDISKEMLDRAIVKANTEKWHFTPVLADIRSVTFPPNSFDIILTIHVLHLITAWKEAIINALRSSQTQCFIDGSIMRHNDALPPFKEYWKLVNQLTDQPKEKQRIGAKDMKDVREFLKTQGYTYSTVTYQVESTISRTEIIDLVSGRYFSSQRNLPETIHQQVIQELAQHDYYLPPDQQEYPTAESFELSFYEQLQQKH